MARPERFELPTTWFEARYSIQLSYGRGFKNKKFASWRHDKPNSRTTVIGIRLVYDQVDVGLRSSRS